MLPISVFGTSISEDHFCTRYPSLIERFIAQIGSAAIGGFALGLAFGFVSNTESVSTITPFVSMLQNVHAASLRFRRYCPKCTPTNHKTVAGSKKVVPSAVTPSESIGSSSNNGAD